MRIRQGLRPEQFTLVEHETVIGRVDGPMVTFVGFRTREAAVQAAEVAYAALRRHGTGDAPGAGSTRPALSWLGDGESIVLRVEGATVAEILPPTGWATDGPGWRVELRVAPSATPELFVLSRARVMWRAIQGYGLVRRMCQFTPDADECRDERRDERLDDMVPASAG